MKLKLFFLSLISLSPTLALFPLVSCGKDQTNPYANLNGGGYWTVSNKSDAQYLVDTATGKCEFKGTGNDIFDEQQDSQERSTVLYWEYANCVARNILDNNISTPFTFNIEVESGGNWYDRFGKLDDPDIYNAGTTAHDTWQMKFDGDENKTFKIDTGAEDASYSSNSLYYK